MKPFTESVSYIPQSSMVSKSISDFNSYGRQNTVMSTRRLDMERNMRSNMTVFNNGIRSKIIFVRVADFLRGPACVQFQQNLFSQYGDYLQFEYFPDVAQIAKINFTVEPVSCIITGYKQRSWAKKFSQNEAKHSNLTVYLMCNDRNVSEYPDIMKNYSNEMLKPVASYPDTQELIRVEYELYSAQYINDVTEKRIRNKFYFKTNSNSVLNIYYEEQLGKIVTPYVNPISMNKKFKKTNFFRYKDLKELITLAKGRRNMKKSHTKKMTSTLATNEIVQSISGVESRIQLMPALGTQSVRDITRGVESEDINYILVTGNHPELEQIKKYCVSQRNTRMLLLDSQKSIKELREQMNIFAGSNSADEGSDRDRIVMSEKLLVIIHCQDILTRAELEQQENFNFHTEIVLFVNAEQLATAIWRVHENENYFGLAILNEDRFAQYISAIETAIGHGTPRQIDNIKILLKTNQPKSRENFTQEYIEDVDPDKAYLTTPYLLTQMDEHSSLIHQIFEARNIFYHPARGIIGTKVNIYIRKNRASLFEMLSEAVNTNKRLMLASYQDRQQLEYLVQKTNKTECSLVVTDEKELLEVMRVIKGSQNVYVLLISAKERLSFDPQVLKTGLEEDINMFIREIPDNEKDAEDESYIETDDKGDGSGVLRRITTKAENIDITKLPGRALLTVRIANNEHSKNSMLFENRIRKHFKEQVNFRFYENTEQIRDMDKSEQPLQFLIINDAYLEWTKRMATVEAKQKFDIIYFTRQPLPPFKELVDKQRYQRFKLVANRWQAIQDYIIGRASKFSKYRETIRVFSSQNVHVILNPRNRQVQQTLTHLARYQNNEIAKRCIYFYHDLKDIISFKKLLHTISRSGICFIVLDEYDGKNRQFEIGNVLANHESSAKQIIISSVQSRFSEHQRTVTVVFNEQEAAEYIASLEFVQSQDQYMSLGSMVGSSAKSSEINYKNQSVVSIKSQPNQRSFAETQHINTKVQEVIQQNGPPATTLQSLQSRTSVNGPEIWLSRPDQPSAPCLKPQFKKIATTEQRTIIRKVQPLSSELSNSRASMTLRQSSMKPPLPTLSKPYVLIQENINRSIKVNKPVQQLQRYETQQRRPTIAIYYQENSPSLERVVDYISNNSLGVQVLNYPVKNMIDAQDSMTDVYKSVDKLLLMTCGRKEYELASRLQDRYPQCRVYRSPFAGTLTELSLVFKLGWQYKLLTLPFVNPAMPDNLIRAKSVNIFVPETLANRHMFPRSYQFILQNYQSSNQLIQKVENAPYDVYNIVLMLSNDLPQLWNLPFRNPNLRYVVLIDKISTRDWFEFFGDIFWLFADSNPKAALDELSKICTDIGKLKTSQPRLIPELCHVLFYSNDQRDHINNLQLLNYRKKMYINDKDLKMNSESQQHNTHLFYQLLTNGEQIQIKPLSSIHFTKRSGSSRIQPLPLAANFQYDKVSEIEDFIEQHELHKYPVIISVDYGQTEEFDLLKLQAKYPSINLSRVSPNLQSQMVSTVIQNNIVAPKISMNNHQSPVYEMVSNAISSNQSNLGIYYLCEWLPIKSDRFMKHVNMNEFTQAFNKFPQQLMIVFCEKDLLRRIPKNIKVSDRVRLVAVTDQQNPEHQLWLRVSELSDVENLIRKNIDIKIQGDLRVPEKISKMTETQRKQTSEMVTSTKQVFTPENRRKILNTVEVQLNRQPLKDNITNRSPNGSQLKSHVTTTRSQTVDERNFSKETSDERILQLPSIGEESDVNWIDENILKFEPILNGQIVRILIPMDSRDLRELLARCLPTLIIIKYLDLDYIHNYVNGHMDYPTIVLLSEELSGHAQELQETYNNIRIIQLGSRYTQKPDVTLNLQNYDQVEYLMSRIMQENAASDFLGDRVNEPRANSRTIEQDTTQIPIRAINQKIYLLLDPLKNRLVADRVSKMAGERVIILPYRSVAEAANQLESLGLQQTILILANNDDIPDLERLVLSRRNVYIIRYMSNHMKPIANLSSGEQVIFTGYTLQAVANFINSLIYRSFNRFMKIHRWNQTGGPKVTRIRSSETYKLKPFNEEKRYKRRYMPSTFGTAARFEYFDEKYVPTEGQSTRDRGSSSQSRPLSRDNRYRLKLKSPTRQYSRHPISEYS